MFDVFGLMTTYWLIGFVWLMTGFLPAPFGWIERFSSDSIFTMTRFAVIRGPEWPYMFAKIVYRTIWHEEKEIEL